MENNDNVIISRYAFERMQAKDERNDHWRNVIILTLIILLVATNVMWLFVWNQYDYVDEDYSIDAQQDGYGVNIVSGGDLDYGADSNNSQTDTEQNAQ